MKLRHFIYSICLAGLSLSACQKEDALENTLDVTSPYALDYLANSQDEIDQRRYEIYQTYGVPVFLHDVITEEIVGTDYKGDPIYKRETLDISWEFYSDANTPYVFDYLQTAEFDESLTEEEIAAQKEQEKADALLALQYAETYLSKAGQTKPFSIMLLKNLKYNGKVLEFHQGFRTLYLSNANKYSTVGEMIAKSTEIIKTTFINAIQLDEAFLAEFEMFSNENHYYSKQWEKDFGEVFSEELLAISSVNFKFRLNKAFDESALTSLANNAYWYYVYAYNMSMAGVTKAAAQKLYYNVEAVREAAMELVAVAAKYGFIGGGWTNDHVYTPNLTNDVEVYVSEIMKLGAGGFEERYGAYPLVMQKFTLMRDYIENVFNFDLNYNTLQTE